jgi:flagellar biosynthesis/type III secretory pathway chaperone
MQERQPDLAESVIDISSNDCPGCGIATDPEDAYCASCGTELLAGHGFPKSTLCANCGQALSLEISFCTTCGAPIDGAELDGLTVEMSSDEPLFIPQTPPQPEVDPAVDGLSVGMPSPQSLFIPQPPPPPEVDNAVDGTRTTGRTRSAVLIAGLVALLVAAAAATWVLWLNGPDLKRFDRALGRSLSVAADVQNATDVLDDPSELSSYEDEMNDALSEIRSTKAIADNVEGDEYASAIEDLVATEAALVSELRRLSALSSVEAIPREYASVPQLASELEESIYQAVVLRDDSRFEAITISATPLTRTLAKLAAYGERIFEQRERIRQANELRARLLAEAQSQADQIDGILARYSDVRDDLAAWIDGVRSHGVSFHAARDVLAQHVEMRSQLRDELAAVEVSDAFVESKAEFLSVMDLAISAVEDASQGFSEDQASDEYNSYAETPGWESFLDSSSEVSSRYGTALSTYGSVKSQTFAELSVKQPLPALPH